jgi:peptidoglycan hydrolase CwlO-like protein
VKVNEKLKEVDKRVDALQNKVESASGELEEVKEEVTVVEKW